MDIKCISCGRTFKIKVNGYSLSFHEKDISVRWARSGKKEKCKYCQKKKLIFAEYEHKS